eukprot:CAMPEP_0179054482 /NCGR_PEP_ID=MMETSP0796-20121207/22809_1 /TAXON_ID=73915 /ORGANISM="Pyrodinium bahamense, Strain pbaha01" /LENGTH=804 /DNA_ID=CAMNT_0020751107 /DNA_START=116 /DNA_END=2530 /DNA_ORIENTATION=+
MAKDQEGVYSQLIANAKSFELQLKALRAEHEALRMEAQALRRCLDRSGILPADELEKELQNCPKPAACEELPPLISVENIEASRTSSWVDTELRVDSACDASSRPPMGLTALGDDTATTSASSPATLRRRTSDSPRRAGSPRTGSGTAAAGAGLASGARSGSPTKPPSRGRSLHQSGEREPSLEAGPKSRPRSRSSARRAADDAELPTDTGGPEGDLYELISKLLDQGTTVVEQQRAVRSVQQLLKRSPEPPNAWSGPGTPLSAVVRAGRADLARLLLRARANVNERDAKGVSALHVATYDGNSELCRVLLVARADVDACDRHGQTPLFFVPNRDICKLLIERRSDVTVLNRKGQSALHLAGRAGLHEVLTWLTSRVSKSLVELRDVHGATARTYAQQSGVPKPETSSPRSSRGRRAASPRLAGSSRPSSPLAPTRAASPPLRGGGGQARSSAPGVVGATAAAVAPPSVGLPTAACERGGGEAAGGPGPRSEGRRSSGQLPYVSELVEGRAAAGTLPPYAHGATIPGDFRAFPGPEDRAQQPQPQRSAAPPPPLLLDAAPCADLEGAGQALHGGPQATQHTATVLEAAAAVATAAVATAAELEAAKKAEPADEAGAFDHEADTWPVQAQADDPAELQRLEPQAGLLPQSSVLSAGGSGAGRGGSGVDAGATREPAALAQEATPEVDLSEIKVVHEMDEDLAELGVMDTADMLANTLLPTLPGGTAQALEAQAAVVAAAASAELRTVAEEAEQRRPGGGGAAAAAPPRAPAESAESARPPAGAAPGELCGTDSLRKLEEELDEVF